MSTRKIAKYDNTFKDRHDAYKGHGTHVAGIAAGRKSTYGSSDETGDADGIARDAKIHFLDLKMGSGGMSDPGASRWFESIYNGGRGAKVMNGSWGRSGRPYSSHCANYDGALFENDDVVMVTSAGNKGDGGPRTIKNPGDCKNTFAVGLTRSSGTTGGDSQVLNWSAKGPTADGRAKPDILAPGYAVLSANSNPYRTNECDSSGGTRSSSGTSMAAPVVAGLAALTRQYFINGYYPNGYQSYGQGFEPQASLVKAVLMNGAQAVKAGQGIDSTRPHDSIQNMGQVNLITSLPLDGANKINAIVVNGKDIADQASDEMVIRVDMTECDEASISVTMAYTDPAAFPGCGSCLVNDLDLTLTDEHGVKYYPNGLSKEDTKNSAERIRLNSVSHNQKFLVKVKASNLSRQSQKYSLVATGCIKEESFVTPTEEPTQLPTYLPTNDPTGEPTSSPTNSPTDYPTGGPTQSPASTEQTAESRLSTSSVPTTKEPAQTATTMAPRRNPIYNGWPDLIP
uniref:subtilisin n=1 Tax=Pseudictyota dubia TaxID=2749911 RepID=A0A7R9VD54_9STRA|mmetsp:Transcript_11386/g.21669  ORF Transcript_11386/g.21669 Transcript_11386/m.21669 type:complete len:512 (+) Transcript_11386:34-1569(+)